MAYTLCEKLSSLTPYEPIEGDYRIRLDANESCFTLPENMLREFSATLSQIPLNRYPDPYAKELCEAFSQFYGLPVDAVTAGNGSDELISLICGSFLQKGDALLTIEPDFSMYRFYGEIFENSIITLQKGDDLRVDLDSVIQTAKERKVSAILFSNPCNPTGQGIPKEEVLRLCKRVEALVVVDEAYMDFWDQSILREAPLLDNLVVLKTCSKAVGLAALRVGFAVTSPGLTRALRSAKSPYNVNAVSQSLARMVLLQKDYLVSCGEMLVIHTKSLYESLFALSQKFPALLTVYPTAANFVFIKSDKAREIHRELLLRSVAVRCFGEYLRISSGTLEENGALLSALSDILVKGF